LPVSASPGRVVCRLYRGRRLLASVPLLSERAGADWCLAGFEVWLSAEARCHLPAAAMRFRELWLQADHAVVLSDRGGLLRHVLMQGARSDFGGRRGSALDSLQKRKGGCPEGAPSAPLASVDR
jgi:hypothetical protein